jgi:hypothetical protein
VRRCEEKKMAVFVAKIANLLGWGEVTTRRGEGWTRNKFRMKLDGHTVTIVQRSKVLKMRLNAARGRFVESSTVRVAGIKTFDEGKEFVEDLCSLISFVKHTRVAAYDFKFGNRRSAPSTIAACNQFRAPFASGVGGLTNFITQAWPAYRAKKDVRAIRQLIHMITLTDAEGTVLETKVTMSMQCLESLKTYFALSEGAHHGLRETREGKFIDRSGREASFRDLLTLALRDVGIPLPPSFSKIVRLRNALVHRGFIRETDNVTRYIFGPLSSGAMVTAIFETLEEVQDILREFVFRLLNYKGPFLLYSDCRGNPKVLT